MDKILRKFGYVKLTNENVLDFYTENLPDLDDYVEIEKENDMFEKLDQVEGFKEWLESVIKRDIKNYFVSQNDIQRSLVRGCYQRVLDIKKRMLQYSKPKEKVTRIPGIRY